MGSFSWTKADNLTKVSNIAYGKPFKFLIPKEFGGGFIKEKYQDYGDLGHKSDGTPKYDIYELFAIWNKELIAAEIKCENYEIPHMKEVDKHTDFNRCLGIELFHSGKCFKYPLKLVSASYTGTYEDCVGESYSDPEQGFRETYRK